MLDLAAHQNDIADKLAPIISEDLKHLGLTMPRFVIENVSLPEEVEAMIDKRSEVGVMKGALDDFTRLQAAEAIGDAANNPSGIAGAGVGIGAGAALGAQLAQALQPTAVPAPAPAAGAAAAAPPPPLPGTTQWYVGENGQQVGPLSPQEVASRPGITPDTLVWKSGMAAWTRLGDVPELASAAPPPLPPA